jgi:hypothetical protein
MPKIRPLSRSSFALAAGLAFSGSAAALGIGSLPTAAVLGQALDFSFEVRLDAGEVLEPSCVAAEVMIGERRLAAPAVRSVIVRQTAGSALVRVLTTVPVDEPVVDVSLGLGCGARVTHRLVLFADPPAIAPSPVTVPVALALAPPPLGSAPAATLVAAPERVATAPSSQATPLPGAQQRRNEARSVATGPGAASTAAPVPARAASAPARPAAAPPAPLRRAAAPAGEAPRLEVDRLQPAPRQAVAPSAAVVEEAIAAVQAAASAARAAAAAASQSAARIRALEQDVARLQREYRARDAEAAELRQRMVAAEGSAGLATPLLLALFAALVLAGWLAWRLRSVQAERERSWHEAADAALSAHGPATVGPATVATAPIPLVNSVLEGEEGLSIPAAVRPEAPAPADEIDRSAPGSSALAGRPSTLPIEPITERTLALPVLGAEIARDVSIEELIDLEQQADFFVVLGQDESAIDLLVEHLRHTGGGSPLPYLKLLEIHRRRDERRAYEGVRDRFNDRFNAHAPDWDTDLQHGRSLGDYAGVLPRLQSVWPRPLDAMAELEALLFRRSRGELFDLPAYRDVLLLYAVARDLNERERSSAGDVDLLLPLADGTEFDATAATSLALSALRRDPATALGGIDLDLKGATGDRGIFIDAQRGRPA